MISLYHAPLPVIPRILAAELPNAITLGDLALLVPCLLVHRRGHIHDILLPPTSLLLERWLHITASKAGPRFSLLLGIPCERGDESTRGVEPDGLPAWASWRIHGVQA